MTNQTKHLYEFGGFRLNAAERLLARDGVQIPLTPKAIDLLLALIAQPGTLLDKETLLKTVWPDSFVEENNLADNIFKLRKALGEGENGLKFIETVPKRGYRFVADVQLIELAPPPVPVISQTASVTPPPTAAAIPSDLASTVSSALTNDSLAPAPSKAPGQAFAQRLPWLLPWLLAAGLAVLLAALGLAYFRRPAPEMRLLKTFVLPPEKSSFGYAALSPDGNWLAYTAVTGSRVRLWLHSLTSNDARMLEATDGASLPFWSPDSRFIGFFAGGKLKKVARTGGVPDMICDAGLGTGGSWSRNGDILFTVLGVPQLSRVPATGGQPAVVLHAAAKQTDLHEPFFLPDGQHFLYLALSSGEPESRGIYISSLNGETPQRLLPDVSNVAYAPASPENPQQGYLLFSRAGALMAQNFDAATRKLSGEARALATQVGTILGANASYRRRNFTASTNGLLIYDPQPERHRAQMLWVDRSGNTLLAMPQLDNVSVPYLSPDDERIVVARIDLGTGNNDLWLSDAQGKKLTRFTFDPAGDILGLWSPDGRRIVWGSARNGNSDLFEKDANQPGEDTLLFKTDKHEFPLDWSRDGQYLLFRQINPDTRHDLLVLPLSAGQAGERKPFVYLQTPAMENGGSFSPDTRWVAYNSDESGRTEVYVENFPTRGGKRQISTAGGCCLRWRADGKELYYQTSDGQVLALPITNATTLATGTPVKLFDFRPVGTNVAPHYFPSRDGQRFLLSAVVETETKAPLTVVQNWQAEINR